MADIDPDENIALVLYNSAYKDSPVFYDWKYDNDVIDKVKASRMLDEATDRRAKESKQLDDVPEAQLISIINALQLVIKQISIVRVEPISQGYLAAGFSIILKSSFALRALLAASKEQSMESLWKDYIIRDSKIYKVLKAAEADIWGKTFVNTKAKFDLTQGSLIDSLEKAYKEDMLDSQTLKEIEESYHTAELLTSLDSTKITNTAIARCASLPSDPTKNTGAHTVDTITKIAKNYKSTEVYPFICALHIDKLLKDSDTAATWPVSHEIKALYILQFMYGRFVHKSSTKVPEIITLLDGFAESIYQTIFLSSNPNGLLKSITGDLSGSFGTRLKEAIQERLANKTEIPHYFLYSFASRWLAVPRKLYTLGSVYFGQAFNNIIRKRVASQPAPSQVFTSSNSPAKTPTKNTATTTATTPPVLRKALPDLDSLIYKIANIRHQLLDRPL